MTHAGPLCLPQENYLSVKKKEKKNIFFFIIFVLLNTLSNTSPSALQTQADHKAFQADLLSGWMKDVFVAVHEKVSITTQERTPGSDLPDCSHARLGWI